MIWQPAVGKTQKNTVIIMKNTCDMVTSGWEDTKEQLIMENTSDMVPSGWEDTKEHCDNIGKHM